MHNSYLLHVVLVIADVFLLSLSKHRISMANRKVEQTINSSISENFGAAVKKTACTYISVTEGISHTETNKKDIDNDQVSSNNEAMQSTDQHIIQQDHTSSNRKAVPLSDQNKNVKKPASLYVTVACHQSAKRPGTIMFIAINPPTDYVITLVPYAESREVEIHGDVCQMTVHAFGLERYTSSGMEWYRVLSHTNSKDVEYVSDTSGRDALYLQLATQGTSSLRNSLPFPRTNSQETKVVQDTQEQSQYTLTGLQGGNKLIFIQRVSEGTTSILKSGTTSMVIPFPLWHAEDYNIHFLEDTRESDHTSTCVPTGMFSFRTKMAQKDVFELYRKCFDFLYSKNPRFLHLPYLYRNKSRMYFNDIMKNKGGWMNGYVKNDGGDPASALNGKIHGLFFSAVLNENTERPPLSSPFGSARLFIPTQWIFNDTMNLYFADFYCHYEHKRHKVQLVLTPKGTEDDDFCQQRLRCLNPYRNPFFYRQVCEDGLVRAFVIVNVVVEVFLAMNLNIKVLKSRYPSAFFSEYYQATTSGDSMKKGIPKRPSCNVCNLSRFCSNDMKN